MIIGQKTRGTTDEKELTKKPKAMARAGKRMAGGPTVASSATNTSRPTTPWTASIPEPGQFVTRAIMHRVTDMGLITSATKQVGARLPTALLECAKKRTGLTSNTDLLVFALANLAVEDNFAAAFASARGTVDADLEF